MASGTLIAAASRILAARSSGSASRQIFGPAAH
jgi:hypothetical protein